MPKSLSGQHHKIHDVREQQYPATHECWPTTAVMARFNEFPAIQKITLRLVPRGTVNFVSLESHWDSQETTLTVSHSFIHYIGGESIYFINWG